MGDMQVRKEAMSRQGTTVDFKGRSLRIAGGRSHAEFESGSEGIVHRAIDEESGEEFRIKCFYRPNDLRHKRSEKLVGLQLADLSKTKADALGGAPFAILSDLSPYTPFAVIMKSVSGWNWFKLRTLAETDAEPKYPPSWWPSVQVRATWAYGLATAVMKMEALGFIHCDLSPGNVVVHDGLHHEGASNTSKDDHVGDMALVDFDRYFYPHCDLSEPGRGSAGYAAGEIWQMAAPQVGSDRVAMAILIQQFLVVGDADINKDEAFEWAYDQEKRLFGWKFERPTKKSQFDAHPLLAAKYPMLAGLLQNTIRASSPDTRPAPQSWRPPLRELVLPTPVAPITPLQGLVLEADPYRPSGLRVSFDPTKELLDLSTTPFQIKANLERGLSGAIYLVVHEGAALNIRLAGSKKWARLSAGMRVSVDVDTVLFDGAVMARLVNSLK